MAGLIGEHGFWYLSRAAGFTSYGLLTASMILGLLVHTRVAEPAVRRNASYDLHGFVSMAALAFVLFHVFILLGDAYFEFTPGQLLLPFASPYRTVAVTVGVLAAYLLVVINASFYVRRFIGYRIWRLLHYTSFMLFVAAAAHGVFAGTDSAEGWARAAYLTSAALVLTLLAYRLQYGLPETQRGALVRLGSALGVATAAVLIGFIVVLARP
jgi:predicted ferric reductase